MGTIATINGIAEDNIATHNGGTAALYTNKNGDTWGHTIYTVATGGSISTSGDYKVHVFNSSGTFQITTLGTAAAADFLVVADGAGARSEWV